MANDLYNVGDVLTIHNLSNLKHLVGLDCIVVKQQAQWEDKSTKACVFGYHVKTTEDGIGWIIPETALKSKVLERSDLDYKLNWEYCANNKLWCPNEKDTEIARELIRTGPWKLF